MWGRVVFGVGSGLGVTGSGLVELGSGGVWGRGRVRGRIRGGVGMVSGVVGDGWNRVGSGSGWVDSESVGVESGLALIRDGSGSGS